jgi:hypothetical protein
MDRLDMSIGLYSTAGWPKVAKYLESDSPTKEGFVNIATSFIGAQHFMIFWEIDHSLWTLYTELHQDERLSELLWEIR